MSNPNHINYARWVGIHSAPAAITFAVLYIPLFGWFIRQSFTRPTYVYFVLTLFCASMQLPTPWIDPYLTEYMK